MQPRVYVSGPLQAARDLPAARTFYEQLAEICARAGWNPYLPHERTDPFAHADAAPESVFARDIEAIRACDAVVAYIGAPSSGVGAELGLAYAAGQPVIALWRDGETPSRFVHGMLQAHPRATLFSFENAGELAERLTAALSAQSGHCAPPKRSSVEA